MYEQNGFESAIAVQEKVIEPRRVSRELALGQLSVWEDLEGAFGEDVGSKSFVINTKSHWEKHAFKA